VDRSSANQIVMEQIARRGPVPLSEVLEVALYDPQAGFYETGGAAGRRSGDFLTSPEVGPLFGAVVARALDAWWEEMGRPDPYVVVDAGAGPGTLARSVLDAAPTCGPALRYVLVERSAAQRRRHAQRKLPLEHPALALPPVDVDTEQPVPEASFGPFCTSLAELPRLAGTSAVVVANELLDNLPFDLAERRGGTWHEVRVGLATSASAAGRNLGEVLVPLDEARAALLDRFAPDVPEGGRAPLQQAAVDWLRTALSTAGKGGRVVVFDYASTTADLAGRPQKEWLRTYRGHDRGVAALADLGEQDVTCEVAVDQLAAVRAPTSDQPQHAWLRSWGIDDLVAEGRLRWQASAHSPDLAALAARSRAPEAQALLDPTGLGAFRTVEWRG
jgi:SAM-dependent MidA family methyltransferase